ncbi:MAG: D-2-hydroxyacid dehydrogenase [Acidobacteria bacterium]|nr:D-2-hydroxyacid dehydrogenase [Acidobacteriota bacterium]
MKALVPAHLRSGIEKALGEDASRFELVSYDQDCRIEGDAAGAEALFRWWIPEDEFHRMLDDHPDLAWVHTGSVGVDHILTPRFLSKGIPLTNSSGVNAVSMAEWVVGCMLAAQKNLGEVFERQRQKRWLKTEEPELMGDTALFIGGGRVASEIATRLRAFGVSTIALTRTGEPREPFDVGLPVEALAETLPKADWVIVSVPLTSRTEGMIGEEELGRMKRSARIVNVARGEIVDERALVRALEDRRIAGAILDVFIEEPLPSDSPLWSMENVVVLPHTTWRSPEAKERQMALFAENLRRFRRGEALVNLVDTERGY